VLYPVAALSVPIAVVVMAPTPNAEFLLPPTGEKSRLNDALVWALVLKQEQKLTSKKKDSTGWLPDDACLLPGKDCVFICSMV
jgi:hypothetical protein